jgi:hypothetical protein
MKPHRDIYALLREQRDVLSPVALAELLDTRHEGGLSQSAIIFNFKIAFPEIPLGVVIDSCGWTRVGGSSLNDEQFNAHFGPWLKGTASRLPEE